MPLAPPRGTSRSRADWRRSRGDHRDRVPLWLRRGLAGLGITVLAGSLAWVLWSSVFSWRTHLVTISILENTKSVPAAAFVTNDMQAVKEALDGVAKTVVFPSETNSDVEILDNVQVGRQDTLLVVIRGQWRVHEAPGSSPGTMIVSLLTENAFSESGDPKAGIVPGYPLSDIVAKLVKCRARHVVVALDLGDLGWAPHLGVLAQQVVETIDSMAKAEGTKTDTGKTLWVIGSNDSGQFSAVSLPLQRSYFSLALQLGLQGHADSTDYHDNIGPIGDHNRVVDLGELSRFVRLWTHDWAKYDNDIPQTPVVWEWGKGRVEPMDYRKKLSGVHVVRGSRRKPKSPAPATPIDESPSQVLSDPAFADDQRDDPRWEQLEHLRRDLEATRPAPSRLDLDPIGWRRDWYRLAQDLALELTSPGPTNGGPRESTPSWTPGSPSATKHWSPPSSTRAESNRHLQTKLSVLDLLYSCPEPTAVTSDVARYLLPSDRNKWITCMVDTHIKPEVNADSPLQPARSAWVHWLTSSPLTPATERKKLEERVKALRKGIGKAPIVERLLEHDPQAPSDDPDNSLADVTSRRREELKKALTPAASDTSSGPSEDVAGWFKDYYNQLTERHHHDDAETLDRAARRAAPHHLGVKPTTPPREWFTEERPPEADSLSLRITPRFPQGGDESTLSLGKLRDSACIVLEPLGGLRSEWTLGVRSTVGDDRLLGVYVVDDKNRKLTDTGTLRLPADGKFHDIPALGPVKSGEAEDDAEQESDANSLWLVIDKIDSPSAGDDGASGLQQTKPHLLKARIDLRPVKVERYLDASCDARKGEIKVKVKPIGRLPEDMHLPDIPLNLTAGEAATVTVTSGSTTLGFANGNSARLTFEPPTQEGSVLAVDVGRYRRAFRFRVDRNRCGPITDVAGLSLVPQTGPDGFEGPFYVEGSRDAKFRIKVDKAQQRPLPSATLGIDGGNDDFSVIMNAVQVNRDAPPLFDLGFIKDYRRVRVGVYRPKDRATLGLETSLSDWQLELSPNGETYSNTSVIVSATLQTARQGPKGAASKQLTFIFDSEVPEVTVGDLGAVEIGSEVRLTATARDSGSGVKTVEWRWKEDGEESWKPLDRGADDTWSTSLTTAGRKPGQAALECRATDHVGWTHTAPGSIQLREPPPPPAAPSAPAKPKTGTLKVTVTDGGREVKAKVTIEGQDKRRELISPFQVDLEPGTYTVTVERIRNNRFRGKTSKQVEVKPGGVEKVVLAND